MWCHVQFSNVTYSVTSTQMGKARPRGFSGKKTAAKNPEEQIKCRMKSLDEYL